MQIAQFVIDLFAVYFASKSSFIARYFPIEHSPAYTFYSDNYWPQAGPGHCAGTENAALLGCAVLTSYLGLFVQFYIQTYGKSRKGPKPSDGIANGSAKVHANGSANGHA
jgi:fatty acid elongase 3